MGDGNAPGQKSKFTMHMYIPEEIALEQEFRAPMYIIGARGANVKAIHERTQSKLRVRGVGSGFKEVKGGFEADCPLHMCVGADTHEQMDMTKKMLVPLFERLVEAY